MLKDIIDLSKITDQTRYIDLSGYAEEVLVVGEYTGDRIVLKNCIDRRLITEGCVINSTRRASDRDALAIEGPARNFEIIGSNFRLFRGGFVAWSSLTNVKIFGLDIRFPNHGIRVSEDVQHKNVQIKRCSISNAQREGIYFGPHTLQVNKSQNLEIAYNRISDCRWDGIQANSEGLDIHDNEIEACALAEEADQWFGILAQVGSTGYIYNNKITKIKRPKATLDSRVFFYPKPL